MKRTIFDNRMSTPKFIEVRDATENNLKHLNVDIPLNEYVVIGGVSGSGKSSLARGVLYSEGSRRYLEALSTYTRRRLTQDTHAAVGSVTHIPCAIALRQRPIVPGIRSTVGTMTELLNLLRLMFSRLASHVCPNGHRQEPTLAVAEGLRIECPICHVKFQPFSAEDFAFNAAGACPKCQGTGIARSLDESKLLNPELTIDQGGVIPWHLPGNMLIEYAAQKMGVRLDVPVKDLTQKELDIIFHGKHVKVDTIIPTSTGRVFHLAVNYYNIYDSIDYVLKHNTNAKVAQRVDNLFTLSTCPLCHGNRFNPKLLSSLLNGKNIAQISQLTLIESKDFVDGLKDSLPTDMLPMALDMVKQYDNMIAPLLDMGLTYLTLDRSASTLSTGELQRIQLARTLRNETTGVLYILDEPSIGLHPANVDGIYKAIRSLVEQGNSVVVVDHDLNLIERADWILEIGPRAGEGGGRLIAQGKPQDLIDSPSSLLGPYLSGKAELLARNPVAKDEMFDKGQIAIGLKDINNIQSLDVSFPLHRLTAVTGVSGSGKTTLVLDGLKSAMEARLAVKPLPTYVTSLYMADIKRVVTIDASPVGKNMRSTVATYAGIMDRLRDLFAAQPLAKQLRLTSSSFSYNDKNGACPTCQGTGVLVLDEQFMPDVHMTCPACGGKRFNPEVLKVKWQGLSIADVLDLSLARALAIFSKQPWIEQKIESFLRLGLGYLRLGQSTPELSGGEAQRLKLVSEMTGKTRNTLYIFDEPTTGLHPQDVHRLIEVFQKLLDHDGTVIVITHDMDLVCNADYQIDLGPGAGVEGGKIVATGTPKAVSDDPKSLTGKYIKADFRHFGMDE